MHWKTFLAAFGSVFLAELGDKTQLMTLSLTTGNTSRLSVFLGAASALVATAALAVLAGDLVSRWISPMWLQRIAGGVMVVLGIVLLVRAGAAAGG